MMNWLLRLLLGLAAIGACWKAWETVYLNSVAIRNIEVAPDAQPEFAVELMAVRRQYLSDDIDFAGSLQPSAQVSLRARGTGYVVELPKDVGDTVEPGQLLARLDASLTQEALRKANAILDVAQAEWEVQQAELRLAEQTRDRERDLAESGAGATRALEQAEAAVSTAKSRVTLAEARIREAQAAVTEAELALRELTLTSPIPGVIAARHLDVGDLAKPEDTLLQIVTLDPILTEVYVPETQYHRLRVGLDATIVVESYPHPFPGTVTRIAPVIDQATRTALVRIEVANPDGLLKPGMHARVRISSDAGHVATVVPVSAIIQTGRRYNVFVADPQTGQVREQEVRTGLSNSDVVEILEGLEEGDHVVTLGSRIVRNGQVVKMIPVPWPETLAEASEVPGNADAACQAAE